MLEDTALDIFINRALLLAPLTIVIVLAVGLSTVEEWAWLQILGVAIGEASVIQFLLWISFFFTCKPRIGEEVINDSYKYRVYFHGLGFTVLLDTMQMKEMLFHLPGTQKRNKFGEIEIFTAIEPADSLTVGFFILIDVICCLGVLLAVFLIYYNVKTLSIRWPAGITGISFGLYILCVLWSITEKRQFGRYYGVKEGYFFMDRNPKRPYEGPEFRPFKLFVKYRDIFDDKMHYTLHAELYLRNAVGYMFSYLEKNDLKFLTCSAQK